MSSKAVFALVVISLMSLASAALSQVRVLGPPPEAQVEWLKSPMVLETPMPVAEVSDARGGWRGLATTSELTGYAVNGVRLDQVSFEFDARRDGCALTVVAVAIVEIGHDKDAVLTFEVVRGEESVWSYTTKKWDLDSDGTTQRRWSVSPRLTSGRCAELAEADGLMLQVTYRVANDV